MPAVPHHENGAPKTELQELQLKSQQVTDEVNEQHITLHIFVHCMYKNMSRYTEKNTGIFEQVITIYQKSLLDFINKLFNSTTNNINKNIKCIH